MNRLILLLVFAAVSFPSHAAPVPDLTELEAMAVRFAPVEISADISQLPGGERQALAKLVQAGLIMDALFLRQVWAGNESLLLGLIKDQTPIGKARLHYFLINKGPWSRLDHNKAFVPGVPGKPAEANFYPAGSSKNQIEDWLETLPAPERSKASGFFSTIRHSAGAGTGDFFANPYSVEYQGELAFAAKLLREASALTSQPTLKTFLAKRAEAFLSNDYFDSDIAWMDLDSSIEPTIGRRRSQSVSTSTTL